MQVQKSNVAGRTLSNSNQQLHTYEFMRWYEKGGASRQLDLLTEQLSQLDALWWMAFRRFKAKFARKRKRTQ